jgi:D-lactate dehydrogenase
MKKIAVFSSHDFEVPFLRKAAENKAELVLISTPLTKETAGLAQGTDAVAVFTSDDLSGSILSQLFDMGIRIVSTRSAGYDHIDIQRANELGIQVANVPAYSPNAIAEYAVTLMLALSRHVPLASQKVNRFDFTIGDLTGFNLAGKTAGIIGTGKIGSVVCKILNGFGCKLLLHDIDVNGSLAFNFNANYVSLETLCRQSDIISIHLPLNEHTSYLIDEKMMAIMKPGVMLINTARGKIIHTGHLIEALQSSHVGSAGLDVYENEKKFFFHDHSQTGIHDKMLSTLIAMPNVILSAHQAFLTREALENIADTTLYNLDCLLNGGACENIINTH